MALHALHAQYSTTSLRIYFNGNSDHATKS